MAADNQNKCASPDQLPGFVQKRLPAIHDVCVRYHVAQLWLYGSAARGQWQPDNSDLDFLVDFAPEARHRYDGPDEHYLHGSRPQTQLDVVYGVNYRALTSALADIFDEYLTTTEGRAAIDVCTYGSIINRTFKRTVDSEKIVLYART